MRAIPPRGIAKSRLSAALAMLRPRTFFRMLARADQAAADTRALKVQVERLEILIQQLATIARADASDSKLELDRVLDQQGIARHVTAAILEATLDAEPFPHLVVDNWLPAEVYRAVIESVPPSIFFADREERRQRLTVPFELAPALSHRVWRFLTDAVVGDSLARALNTKFAPVIRDYVASWCPDLPSDVNLNLYPSDGRIMLRRPGYVIEPHRDPKWGFLTGIVYLARQGDNETHGTQLYRVRGDADAPNAKPYYIDSARCELVKSVPFRGNTLLVFMNSRGAHGASIPADAHPPDLTRLVYQFRLGPSSTTIRKIVSCMSGEQRNSWSGSKEDRWSPAPGGK